VEWAYGDIFRAKAHVNLADGRAFCSNWDREPGGVPIFLPCWSWITDMTFQNAVCRELVVPRKHFSENQIQNTIKRLTGSANAALELQAGGPLRPTATTAGPIAF